jgi:hypothetical protein
MNNQETGTVTCTAAVERLVEAGGRPADGAVEAHVGSCMSCFRAMTDLRDLPRVADALRAAAPPVPAPDDAFWGALARRTTDAVTAALAVEPVVEPLLHRASPVQVPSASRRRPGARFVSLGALAVAAAASWVVMVHRPTAPQGPTAPATTAAAPSRDEGGGDALPDVAELDATALRQLLDRLGRHAPAALAGGTSDGTDGADVPVDDEARVSDEVADLDGDALRRVESSLAGAAL